jgi:hypothetical protein
MSKKCNTCGHDDHLDRICHAVDDKLPDNDCMCYQMSTLKRIEKYKSLITNIDIQIRQLKYKIDSMTQHKRRIRKYIKNLSK